MHVLKTHIYFSVNWYLTIDFVPYFEGADVIVTDALYKYLKKIIIKKNASKLEYITTMVKLGMEETSTIKYPLSNFKMKQNHKSLRNMENVTSLINKTSYYPSLQ